MSIRIDRDLCTGCGACAEVCPGNLLCLDSGKSVLCNPRDCWGCASCVKSCPTSAISLYLGADMGGLGSEMTVREEGSQLVWTIRRHGQVEREIVVDRTASNQY